MPPPMLIAQRVKALLLTNAIVECEPSVVKDTTSSVVVRRPPLVMVKPEMVTFDAKFSNTRKVALPLTARFPAPGPLMVTLWII